MTSAMLHIECMLMKPIGATGKIDAFTSDARDTQCYRDRHGVWEEMEWMHTSLKDIKITNGLLQPWPVANQPAIQKTP